MQDLLNKTQELEDLAVSINDVISEYTKIIMKIEEIHFLQLKIETKLEMNYDLQNEYNKWKKEKLNLIFWFIRLGKYIAGLKKQNIILTESERTSLKNLMQFLTKYNLICQEESESPIKDKIEIQINSLFQNIFKTDKKLIKGKEIVSKIVPYFDYNSNKSNHNYFKDSFKINLHTNLYSDENFDLPTCCYYDSNIPRKVISLLVNDGKQNVIINSEEELTKINDYQILGVYASCLDIVEGWYKFEDIKKNN